VDETNSITGKITKVKTWIYDKNDAPTKNESTSTSTENVPLPDEAPVQGPIVQTGTYATSAVSPSASGGATSGAAPYAQPIIPRTERCLEVQLK